jgi:putative ABC transport system ATP-binding protein
VSTSIESTSHLGTWDTLRRGLELSPEIRKGIWVTLALAAVTTAGRVVVPLAVQQTTDHGLLAEGGPDTGMVWRYVGFAAVGGGRTPITPDCGNVRRLRAAA